MNIEKRLKKVIRNNFPNIDQKKLTSSVNFHDDLGMDSLDSIELLMAIEEEFVIMVPDADAEKIKTFNSAVEYIRGRI